MKTLNYIIIKPRNTINLSLFEGERYESAILIQQLVGNLVYFSNYGRYEPRIASSWRKINDRTWSFKFRKKFKTELNEEINPLTFKKSLERSIFIFEKNGGVPILSNLTGYRDFIDKSKDKTLDQLPNLSGLVVEDDNLVFNFDVGIKSGLLQILSFSPFGFISRENFDDNGNWKNNERFISSGPYKVESMLLGHSYNLVKNENWQDFSIDSPSNIIITHDDNIDFQNKNVIIDAFTNEYKQENLNKYKLVPEYLNSVLIGNYETGFFSDKKNRRAFRKKFNSNVIELLPEQFGVNTRSLNFYPNQKNTEIFNDDFGDLSHKRPQILIIEGDIPIEGTSRWYAWLVLKKTFEDLNWDYKFNGNKSIFTEMTNRKYDIRIRGSSIGGGVESWGLYIAFCSSVGINFPDPNNRVCSLLNRFDADLISEKQMTSDFFEAIEDEAAILPVSHYGVSLFISDTINTSSISPLLAIIKFDKLVID
ncbi:MAG: ABC transporter substrate-binding protein [Pseudobdellovibrio sp.]